MKGYGIGRKLINKMTVMDKLFVIGVALSIGMLSMPLLIFVFACYACHRLFEKQNLLKDNKAESPIEIIVTIMVFLLLMTGVVFVEGAVIDGFLFQFSKLPITLSPQFQTMMMNSPIMFASIFFSIPAFFGAVLIVWGVKSIIRKHGYTRTGEEIYYDEEF